MPTDERLNWVFVDIDQCLSFVMTDSTGFNLGAGICLAMCSSDVDIVRQSCLWGVNWIGRQGSTQGDTLQGAADELKLFQ